MTSGYTDGLDEGVADVAGNSALLDRSRGWNGHSDPSLGRDCGQDESEDL
jgi:hypothetical protein